MVNKVLFFSRKITIKRKHSQYLWQTEMVICFVCEIPFSYIFFFGFLIRFIRYTIQGMVIFQIFICTHKHL